MQGGQNGDLLNSTHIEHTLGGFGVIGGVILIDGGEGVGGDELLGLLRLLHLLGGAVVGVNIGA
jgi:hypothetical protein